jgi:hypothetical protein
VSAPVRIEARAWSDLRFATLARLLGLADADHALIKVARLWSWQTEHFAPDAPTYEVDADTIESVLGPGGPAALVRAKLADETLTGYRIKGTEGQIEWCDNLSSKRQQAGRARAEGARRDAKGRLLPHYSGEQEDNYPAHGPANHQHASSAQPARSSAPSPSPAPSPEEDLEAGSPDAEPADPPAAPLRLLPEPPVKRRKKAKHDMPEDWHPTARQRETCRQMGLDVEDQVRRFRNHHLAKGNQFASWDRAFDTWLDNALRFAEGTRAGPHSSAARANLPPERPNPLRPMD